MKGLFICCIRAGHSSLQSCWIVEFGSHDETPYIKHWFKINGDIITVRLLKDVHEMEFQEYKFKKEEQRRQKESELTTTYAISAYHH
jgi:hypothetical protein